MAERVRGRGQEGEGGTLGTIDDWEHGGRGVGGETLSVQLVIGNRFYTHV